MSHSHGQVRVGSSIWTEMLRAAALTARRLTEATERCLSAMMPTRQIPSTVAISTILCCIIEVLLRPRYGKYMKPRDRHQGARLGPARRPERWHRVEGYERFERRLDRERRHGDTRLAYAVHRDYDRP